VLIEEDLGGQCYEGRAAHQAPEVDGVTTVRSPTPLTTGGMVRATVVTSQGVDLVADALPATSPAAPRPSQTR
jgi:ribosomal protein S12 methylthiotransferase